jgi:hypothetical protein
MWRVERWMSGVIVVCCVLVQFAPAAEPAGGPGPAHPWQSLVCPDALLRACCPHYCPKPMPCIDYICRGCCPDSYCKKPCPCVPCYPGSCQRDCFCRKPCPDLCRPLAADNVTFAGSSAWCSAGGASEGNVHVPQPHRAVPNSLPSRGSVGSLLTAANQPQEAR